MSLKDKLIELKKKIEKKTQSAYNVAEPYVKNKYKEVEEKFNNIKNLVVQNVKEKTKYVVNKNKKGAIAIGLAAVLTLSGCGISKIDKATTRIYNPTTQTTTETTTQTTPTHDFDFDYADGRVTDELTSTRMGTNISGFSSFKNFLMNYNTEYSYDYLYNIDGVKNKIVSHRNPTQSHLNDNIIQNNKVNVDAFVESVYKKSAPYKEETGHYMYKNIEDKGDLKKILTYVADSINYDLEHNNDIDIKALNCKLSNLKAYYSVGATSAAITDENCLLVNENIIKMVGIASDNENEYRNTLYHESKHIMQKDCPCYEKSEYIQTGTSIEIEGEETNPYLWYWCLEGSAEKGAGNMTGDAPSTYKYLVNYVDTINLSTIANLNTNSTTIVEDSTFKRDRTGFYKALGEGSFISHDEITKMMYSMEICQQRVENFQELYQKKTGKEMSDAEYKEVQKILRKEFCISATKIFYGHLTNAIMNNASKVTIEDIFYLVNLFEADINFHIQYKQDFAKQETKDFISEYSKIQSEFFNALSISSNISYDELINKYDNYAMYYDNGSEKGINATFNWLHPDKVEYLKRKSQSSSVEYSDPVILINNSVEKGSLSK